MILADIIVMGIIQRAIPTRHIVESLSHEFTIDVAQFPTVWMHDTDLYRFNGSNSFIITLLLFFNLFIFVTYCHLTSCCSNRRLYFISKDLVVDMITNQFLCSLLNSLEFFDDNLINRFFRVMIDITN